MSNPLVSIIIPAYNAEKYIEETIRSALAQTWPHTEIIIVDDGSTDSTLPIAKGFEDANVKICSQVNKGAAAARNYGLSQAKGYYIQFLDADDLLSPDKIESQVNCLNATIRQLSICKHLHFYDGENYPVDTQEKAWFHSDTDNPVDFLTKLYAGNEVMPGYGGMIPLHAWLTPRLLIDEAGVWNEKLTLDDDGEFFCRVVLASEGIKFSSTGLCYYRKFDHAHSLSAQKTRKSLESAIASIDFKFGYLKAKISTSLINRIFARHYWWNGVLAYPQFKSLSKYCINRAKELGYSGEKYVGGPAGHTLTSYVGWKVARRIAYYQQLLKR
jgi:glycosyltransferase involved in cell wall biosynthesis